jgi:iron complex outermembrane receptor protein
VNLKILARLAQILFPRQVRSFSLRWLFGLLAGCPGLLCAADSGTGSITGRVLNASSGRYLESANVEVVGTNLQTRTDQSGQYLLYNVPAGQVTVRVAYTGQTPLTESVTVQAGTSVTEDFKFGLAPGSTSENGATVLDQFVVLANKETNAQQLAINEQRAAPNIKTVVAADSFGAIMEGNVADFVKYVPGITVDYGSEVSAYGNAADAQRISIRGVPSNMIPITIDGLPVADAASNLTRTYEMEQLSINNASRVEVIDQPTPDMPFNSPAGVINLVSKSAFEYAHREFDFRLYASANNEDTTLFNKEPGPHNKSTYHTLPGFDFSYIMPIGKTFGVTVSGLSSNQYNTGEASRSDWTYTGAGSFTNPYFNRIRFVTQPRDAYRESASVKFDWKPNQSNTLSLAYSVSLFSGFNIARTEDFNKLTPTGNLASNYGPTFVTSASTSVSNNGSFADKAGNGQNMNLLYRFRHGPWQIDAASGLSISSTHLDSAADGYVSDYSVNLNGVKGVNAAGIENGVPSSLVSVDANGAPIDYTQLSNYKLPSSINIGSSAARDVFSSAKLDVRRDLDFLPFSWMILAAKAGGYATRQHRSQYGAGESPELDLVTANQPANLTASSFLDTVNSGYAHHYAGAGNQQWLDPFLLYQFYINNPTVYALNAPASYHTYVNNQKDIIETDGQYYFQLDASFLRNRLRVVAGVRGEKDYSVGHVPYTNARAAFELNPDGSYVLVNGSRVLVPNLTTLQEYQLIYTPLVYQSTRSTVKPNEIVNASYNILPDLVGQVNYSKTYGKQNFNSLTQANGGVPSITEAAPGTTGADGNIGTIQIPNPGLPPEIAQNWDFKLAYYTKNGGVISANYYRKSIRNYTFTTTTLLTPANVGAQPADLPITPSDFLNYDLITTNVDPTTVVTQSGWEYSVIQDLRFIPHGGNHFSLFANYTTKSQSGIPLNADANTPNNISSTSAGGITFSWAPVVLSLKMTNSAQQTLQHFTAVANGITTYWYQAIPGTRRYDASAEYQLSSRFSLFANARNVFNAHQKTIIYGPGQPTYAFPENNYDFGVQINIGVRGTF